MRALGKVSGTYWVVANLFGLRNTSHLGRFVWMREEGRNARLTELVHLSSRSPEDMAEKSIFRKFACFNSAAVA